ncbi:MAG: hypothetical protein H5U04_05110 [Firmicutes bacterium]|nr:hypothetical protein [Bacillota bacterium]MDI6823052.1 hypothetical protein [Bacillota bacterium]MDI7248508.1 hypothetical protein [Bacillota bacterium]
MALENLRCQCKKIVCQIEGDEIWIKCRHCKRMIVIRTRGIESITSRDTSPVTVLQPSVV